MTEDRSYHKGMSSEEAAQEIMRHAGTQFDPDVARVFVEKNY
jgi:HD-GYP domain-containing protein (c-di-GMP phosphodiesterase class II)